MEANGRLAADLDLLPQNEKPESAAGGANFKDLRDARLELREERV
jgi:hypothetical protein